MKHVFFALAIFVSFSTSAFAKTIAQLPVKISYDKYAIVQLDDSRELVVNSYKVLDPRVFGGDQSVEQSVRVELDDALYTKLLFKSIQLSNAELDVRVQDVVCLMIAPPGPSSDLSVRSGYDRHEGFNGDLRVVLTQRGCWAHTHVSPKYEHNRNVAYQLTGSLEALALQALAQN